MDGAEIVAKNMLSLLTVNRDRLLVGVAPRQGCHIRGKTRNLGLYSVGLGKHKEFCPNTKNVCIW